MDHQPTQYRASDDIDSRVFGLEKDVAGLKDSVNVLGGDMRRGFESIMLDLKAKSATNWQPIGMAVAAVLTMSGWGFSFIGSFQSRMESQIAKIEMTSNAAATKDDVKERFVAAGLRRDDAQRMTDARVERVEKDLNALQAVVVPLGQHNEIWSGQRLKDENIQRQIDAVKKQVDGLNTPRDTLQNMLKRLDDIERAALRDNKP